MEVRIRKCDSQDAPFLARFIIIAGRAHLTRGIWEVILNTPEEECLHFLETVAVSEIPHLFHYSCYYIAESPDGIPIGCLGGYDPEKLGYHALQQSLPGVYRKLAMAEQDFKGAQERAAKILTCLPKEIKNAWVIDSVATMPEYRDLGVAERLMKTILTVGKKRDYSMAQIVMYIGNEPALQLYKKMGFKIIEETRSVYFEKMIGSPGMLSLSRRI